MVRKREDLGAVSLREEFAAAEQDPAPMALVPPPEPEPEQVVAPAPRGRKQSAPEIVPAVTEEDLHVTTVKLPRPWYILLQDLAVDRVRNKRRGSPNIGELVREAVGTFLKKEGKL